MRSVQKFSREYLELCKSMKPDQIVKFLDDFRKIHAPNSSGKSASRLISLRVEESLLDAFKTRCRLLGVPYQTQIKTILREWLTKE